MRHSCEGVRFRSHKNLTLDVYHILHSHVLKKWKDLCVRHVEELSLMESYQFVKREGNSATS
jgi:hypothetical protein